MSYQEPYLRVGSVGTRFRVSGTGSPVVLLHGIGRSLEDWSATLGPLSRHHTVYAFDQLGFGRTDKPDIAYTTGALVDFTLSFMDALGLGRVALVGNSMGGLVGLLLALEHPERVSSLVLAAPAGLGRGLAPSLRLCTLPGVGELLTRSAPDDAGHRRVLQACFHDPRFVTDERVRLAHELAALPGRQRAFLRALRASCTWRGLKTATLRRTLGRLADLRAPTLVIWGRQDGILPAAYAGRVPGAAVRVFEACGHLPQLEHAEAFNREVLAFLGGERGTRR